MGYFVHLPFNDDMLIPREKILNRHGIVVYDGEIACYDATVIGDKDGNQTGWVDNNGLISVFVEDDLETI